MSGHGQHDSDADGHAARHDHPETSSDDFPADEPRSPGWLPLLGGALFLAGIFAFVVFGSDPDEAANAATPAPAAQASAPAPAARQMAAPAKRPGTLRPALAVPPGREPFVPHPAQ